MRLPRFDYFEPKSLSETLTLLSTHADGVVKAGGTDLLPRLKWKLVEPTCLINLKGLSDLDFIRRDNQGNLSIGAVTPLSKIETSPLVRRYFGALAEALSHIGSPEIRHMGTLGGNACLDTRCQYYNQSPLFRKGAEPCLKVGGAICYVSRKGNQCHALFCADTVPLLIASDAKLIIASSRGERSVSLQDFYTGNGKTPFHLSQNELVVEVQIPKRVEGTRAFYLKFRFRDAIDFPLVGVALSGVKGQDNGFKEIRVVAGGATPAPVRCLKAEEILRNEKITDPVLEEAGELAAKEVPIVSSSLCPASYRKTLVRQLVIRGGRMFSGQARGGLQSD